MTKGGEEENHYCLQVFVSLWRQIAPVESYAHIKDRNSQRYKTTRTCGPAKRLSRYTERPFLTRQTTRRPDRPTAPPAPPTGAAPSTGQQAPPRGVLVGGGEPDPPQLREKHMSPHPRCQQGLKLLSSGCLTRGPTVWQAERPAQSAGIKGTSVLWIKRVWHVPNEHRLKPSGSDGPEPNPTPMPYHLSPQQAT